MSAEESGIIAFSFNKIILEERIWIADVLKSELSPILAQM